MAWPQVNFIIYYRIYFYSIDVNWALMRTICLIDDECHLMSPTSVSLGQNIHHTSRLCNENLLEFSFF